jgi:phosphoenolpyruvate phosphomutase
MLRASSNLEPDDLGKADTMPHEHLLPEVRRGSLCRLLAAGKGLRFIEAHSGLSALIGSRAMSLPEQLEFDGLWISSLTCTAAKGLPDMEMYVVDRRFDLISEICQITSKPIIVDGDTGGDETMLKYYCRFLEAIGVSAIVIEDKQHPKRNSLSAHDVHTLEAPDIFARKLTRAREDLCSDEFIIIARIESLMCGNGMDDAISRARTYLLAGAGGIMIHSKSPAPDEIYEFMERYERLCGELGFRRPAMCVPTTYNKVEVRDLFKHGVQIVVHANHLLRAAHAAMERVCESLLRHDCSREAESECVTVSRVLESVGYSEELRASQQFKSRSF